MENRPKLFFYHIVILLMLTASYSVLFIDADLASSLAKEDSLFEYLSALFFLATSVFCFISFLRTKNIFLLLLSFVFFFGFGEEVSWGQRILNFKTPAWMGQENLQGEANIHNLELFHRDTAEKKEKSWLGLLLNFDRLFSLFWLSYCFLVPLLSKLSAPFARLVKTIKLPLVSLRLGIYFPILYLLAKTIEFLTGGKAGELHWAQMEIKECLFAFLFCMVGFYFFQLYGKKSA